MPLVPNRWLLSWALTVTATGTIAVGALLAPVFLHQAPFRLSDSISYDAKLNFIVSAKTTLLRASTLVVGSSFALNNIDSRTLSSETLGEVINLGSWGLTTTDTLRLLQIIAPRNKRYIIYASQYSDISSQDKLQANPRLVGRFVSRGPGFSTLLSMFEKYPAQMGSNLAWSREHMDPSSYKFLNFDQHGDVNYQADQIVINPDRWRKPAFRYELKDEDYSALLALSRYCKDNNAELIVVRTPYRDVELNPHPALRRTFNLHGQKLKTLSVQGHFLYVDTHQTLQLSDRYFVDIAHLNAQGAELVSKQIIRHMRLMQQDQFANTKS